MYNKYNQFSSYPQFDVYNQNNFYNPHQNPYQAYSQNNPYNQNNVQAQADSYNPYFSGYLTAMSDDLDQEADRDLEYMKELYPKDIKRIQNYVEEVCDHADYEGSAIYDEYPDRLALHRMRNGIMGKIEQDEIINASLSVEADRYEENEIEIYERKKCRGRECKQNQWVSNIVEVLLYHELYKRRCKHRGCKRNNWY